MHLLSVCFESVSLHRRLMLLRFIWWWFLSPDRCSSLQTLFFFSPQQPVNRQCSGISFIFSSPVCRTGKHVVKILSKLSRLTEKCAVYTRQTYCGGANEAESIKTSHFHWYLSNWFSWPMNSMFFVFLLFCKNAAIYSLSVKSEIIDLVKHFIADTVTEWSGDQVWQEWKLQRHINDTLDHKCHPDTRSKLLLYCF